MSSSSQPSQASAQTDTSRHYQTRQKELVSQCLLAHAGAYLTAHEVAYSIAEQGKRIGMATVYRNLDKLVEQGCAVKSVVDGADGTCARYRAVLQDDAQDDGQDQDQHGSQDSPTRGHRERTHFYLKCEECGQLVPIECPDLEGFYRHFDAEHHVHIDPIKTVLYGTCSTCLGASSATNLTKKESHQ